MMKRGGSFPSRGVIDIVLDVMFQKNFSSPSALATFVMLFLLSYRYLFIITDTGQRK